MQLTINIKEENKVNFILELIKSFDYIDILKDDFTTEQKAEIDRRLDLIEKGETKLHSWDEIKNEITALL
ncbi:MAG: addiction module protein [Bacteroidales bacterium]|nr:addiction module protein [Bacteroidales bacterium]